jgi:hypothetical protein
VSLPPASSRWDQCAQLSLSDSSKPPSRRPPSPPWGLTAKVSRVAEVVAVERYCGYSMQEETISRTSCVSAAGPSSVRWTVPNAASAAPTASGIRPF